MCSILDFSLVGSEATGPSRILLEKVASAGSTFKSAPHHECSSWWKKKNHWHEASREHLRRPFTIKNSSTCLYRINEQQLRQLLTSRSAECMQLYTHHMWPLHPLPMSLGTHYCAYIEVNRSPLCWSWTNTNLESGRSSNMVPFTHIIAATALAFSASVQATCYGSGQSYCEDNKAEERQHVYNMCNGYSGNRGALQNVRILHSLVTLSISSSPWSLIVWLQVYFRPHNESPNPATVCVNTACGQKIVVQVTNLWDSGRNLSPSECYNGLVPEVDGCWFGGESDKNGWRFRCNPLI